MTINIVTPTPDHGAAYWTLYDRLHPDYCSTDERANEIRTELARVREWAKTQDALICRAYIWAANDIQKRVDTRMKAQVLSRAVVERKASIPVPPGFEKDAAKP